MIVSIQRALFIFLLSLTTSIVYSQDTLSLQQEQAYSRLKDSSQNMLGFGCGYSGFYTDNLSDIRILINGKRIDLITHLLASKIPSTQYLAAQSLLLIYCKESMDSITLQKVNLVRSSEKTVAFCNGCMGSANISLKALLDLKVNKKGFVYKMYIKRTIDWLNISMGNSTQGKY